MTEDLVVALPPPLPPGFGDGAGAGDAAKRPNYYCGAPRKEHRQPPVIRTSPYSVTEGYRAVGRIVLPPTEKALLIALFLRVDSKTWRWPPREDGDKRGSSMVELAACIRRSVRHTRRLVRRLEARGLLITYDRRPERNAYQIVPEALIAAGEAGRDEVREVVQSYRAARAALQAAADEAIDRDLAGETGPSSAPESQADTQAIGELDGACEADAAPAAGATSAAALVPATDEPLPRWVTQRAKKDGLSPLLLGALSRAAWRAAGSRGLWLNEGGEARAVVRLWRNLGEPTVDDWTALMVGLAGAARSGRLTGLLPRGWSLTTRGLLKLAADVRARELATVPPPAPPRSAGPTPTRPDRGEHRLAGPALPGGPSVERWKGDGQALLSRRMGALYAIWVVPLSVAGVDEHGLVLRSPNVIHADWVARHLASELVEAAGGPVHIIWGD